MEQRESRVVGAQHAVPLQVLGRCGPIVCAGICVAIAVLTVGCVTGLPEIRQDFIGDWPRGRIPTGAAPLYSWQGSRDDLKTYWGDQQVSVRVTAYLPDVSWKEPGDGYWQVTAENGERKPIPFIGVVRKYRNERGTELAVLVPPLDLNKAPDGLYLVIVPGVETRDGSISCIRPTAQLREIRHHTFKPFCAPIPLMPMQESPVTPRPEDIPETPTGTPIPIDSRS